jgi:hypothetical protein
MIALRNGLPLVALAGGEALAFDPEWLILSISKAARLAGYPQWWLCEHVTESVTHYLKTQNTENVLQHVDLENSVRSVLQCIGYSEVSQHFALDRPPAEISVLDLAKQAGTGYELAFFELLAQSLHFAIHRHHGQFSLCGLESAVKLLCARKAWSRGCNALRSEIVAFVRKQAELAAGNLNIVFSLK